MTPTVACGHLGVELDARGRCAPCRRRDRVHVALGVLVFGVVVVAVYGLVWLAAWGLS